MAFVYVYPPTAVSVSFPPGAATEAKQDDIISLLESPSPLSKVILDFSTTSVSNASWVQLLASVGASKIRKVQVFMSSGEPLELAFGASSSEVSQLYIIPGGNGIIDLTIPAGTRLSVKAVNAVTVNTGILLVNLLG